jgi:hypothetical protein
MNRTKSHHLAVAAMLVAMTASTTGTLASLAVVPASAATTCDVGADFCVVGTQTVQTPLGPVTVTVSTTNVVTVQLAPTTPDTLVFGVPFGIPPGPPGLPGYARTSISTTGGLINIDTVLWPQGSPSHFTAPNLAIISIHPPGPCRARTSGMTVVFTPIFPPGPPT